MLEYVGEGAFWQGVPARDLSDEEAIEYGGAEALVSSGLYRRSTDTPEVEIAEEKSTARKRSEVKHGG